MDIDYTRLLRRLFPEDERDGAGAIRLRTMTISAVNGDGTVDLTSGGATIPDVPRLDSSTVANGNQVQVLVSRGQLLVLGRIATS